MATYKSYSSHLGTDGPNPVKRAKPRLVVRRGYAGNETSALSRSLPCSEAIKSGELVTPVAGEWAKAEAVTAAGLLYLAYHDSSDPDVISCNALLAFDLNGDYEFETGYYQDGGAPGNLADGVALVCGSGATDALGRGQLIPATKANATANAVVVGYMRGGEVDLSEGQYSSTVENMSQDTQADAAGSKVIRFVTA